MKEEKKQAHHKHHAPKTKTNHQQKNHVHQKNNISPNCPTKKEWYKNKNFIQNLISVILGVLIIPALGAVIILFNLNCTLLNPQFYKKSFVEADFYHRIVDDGLPSIIESYEFSQNAAANLIIEKGALYAVQKLFPPQFIQQYSEQFIDRTVRMFQTPPPPRSAILDTSNKIRNEYLGRLSNIMGFVENSIPTCEPGLITMILPNLNCNEINPTLEKIKSEIQVEKEKLDGFIAKYDVANEKLAQLIFTINDIRNITSNLEVYAEWSLIILVLLTIGFIIVWFKEVFKVIKWMSGSYLVSSILLLLATFIQKGAVIHYINTQIYLNTTPEINSIINYLLNVLATNFFHPIIYSLTIIIIVSAIILAAAFVVEWQLKLRKNKK